MSDEVFGYDDQPLAEPGVVFVAPADQLTWRFESLWECLTLAGWSPVWRTRQALDPARLAPGTLVVLFPLKMPDWPGVASELANQGLRVVVVAEPAWSDLVDLAPWPGGVTCLVSAAEQAASLGGQRPSAILPPALTAEIARLALDALLARIRRAEEERPGRLAWIGGPGTGSAAETKCLLDGLSGLAASWPGLELHLFGPPAVPPEVLHLAGAVQVWPLTDATRAWLGLEVLGWASEATGREPDCQSDDRGPATVGETGGPGGLDRWRLLEQLAGCDLLLMPKVFENGSAAAAADQWAVLLSAAVGVPALVIGRGADGEARSMPELPPASAHVRERPGPAQEVAPVACGGGPRPLVEDGVTGRHVELGNWPAAARELLSDRRSLRQLGWAARARAIGAYSTTAQRWSVARAFAQLADERHSPAPRHQVPVILQAAGPIEAEAALCQVAVQRLAALGLAARLAPALAATDVQPVKAADGSGLGAGGQGRHREAGNAGPGAWAGQEPPGAAGGSAAPGSSGPEAPGAWGGAGPGARALHAARDGDAGLPLPAGRHLKLAVAADDHALEHPMGPDLVAHERVLRDSDLVAAFGPWLARRLAHRYGVRTIDVALLMDAALFHPQPGDREPLVVYALPPHRRPLSLDLGVQALQHLQGTCREVRIALFGLPGDEIAREGIGLRYEWLGKLTPPARAKLLRRAAVLLWTEFMNVQPLVAEAMASGCAVVAVDLPHQRWLLVDDQTARLATPRADLLSEAIRGLLRDAARRQRLVANAYHAVAELAIDRSLADLVAGTQLAIVRLAEEAVAGPPAEGRETFQARGGRLPDPGVVLQQTSAPLPPDALPGLPEPSAGPPVDPLSRPGPAGAVPRLDLLQPQVEQVSPWSPGGGPAPVLTFLSRHDGLSGIDLGIAADSSVEASSYLLHLGQRLDPAGHVVPLVVADRPGWDGRWLTFRFPPLNASGGRRLYAELAAEGRPARGVGLWVASCERLPEARLLVGGQVTAVVPAFRTWVTACPREPIALPPATAAMLNRLLTLEGETDLVRRRYQRDRRSLPYRLRHPMANVPRRLPPAGERPWPADAPLAVKLKRALREYGLVALLAEIADWLRWQRMTAAERQRAAERQPDTRIEPS